MSPSILPCRRFLFLAAWLGVMRNTCLMSLDPRRVRRQVLRRVRYATNLLALEADRVPPEGPFDAALTNGVLAIVAEEWPGADAYPKGDKMLPASELLTVIKDSEGLPMVDVPVLCEAVDLTQPFRHGRADDEFATIGPRHQAALAALDQHHSLRFIEAARGRSLDECVVLAFTERAEEELPFDPKVRLDVPEPSYCDGCYRLTFLRSGWDMFGGDDAGGFCIACGYEVSEDDAYGLAVEHALSERVNDDT